MMRAVHQAIVLYNQTMIPAPMELWQRFCAELSRALESATDDQLARAWSTHTDRTSFYRERLLHDTAVALGYKFGTELFKVDFVMWTQDTNPPVPVIFIESENHVTTAHHEIQKLACIAAPLRVLIVPVEWDEEAGVWASGGMRRQLLAQWQQIVRSYNQVWPRHGILGLVIGEWRRDGHLRFYANAFDAAGNLQRAPDDILIHRKMPERDLKFVEVVDDAGQTFTHAVPLTEAGQQLLGQFTDDPKGEFGSAPGADMATADERVAVLIAVENDRALLERISVVCQRDGYFIQAVESPSDAIQVMQQVEPTLLLLRLRGKHAAVLEWARNNHPAAMPILVVDTAEVEGAVEAIKVGALDYLSIPFADEELQRAIDNAIAARRARFAEMEPR